MSEMLRQDVSILAPDGAASLASHSPAWRMQPGELALQRIVPDSCTRFAQQKDINFTRALHLTILKTANAIAGICALGDAFCSKLWLTSAAAEALQAALDCLLRFVKESTACLANCTSTRDSNQFDYCRLQKEGAPCQEQEATKQLVPGKCRNRTWQQGKHLKLVGKGGCASFQTATSIGCNNKPKTVCSIWAISPAVSQCKAFIKQRCTNMQPTYTKYNKSSKFPNR
jgi:hypothetical protein